MIIKGIISREIRAYLFWGLLAAVVNIGTFTFLLNIGLEYTRANLYALLLNRMFCYVTNKLFVFKTRYKDIISLFREMVSFFISRLVTLAVDYVGLIVLVELFSFNELASKIVVAVAVVTLNYLSSVFVVFKK